MDELQLSEEMITSLRLRDLRFVQRVAESKSLSGAAASLSLTQPAASRLLRELEQLFRGHLFVRDRMAGMVPTPLGRLVVDRARALLADVALLSSEIGMQREGRGGHLRLGVIPYVSSRLMERTVSTLVSERGMTVSLIEGATGPLLDALKQEHLHAVVGRCPLQIATSGIRHEVLFTQTACLLVHSRHASQTDQVKLSSFAAYRWVAPPRDSPTWQAIVAAYANARTTLPVPIVETASTKIVHALIANGTDMVAVVPHDVGCDLEKLGGVKVLPFPARLKMPPVGLMAPSRHWNFSTLVQLRNTLHALIATGEASG